MASPIQEPIYHITKPFVRINVMYEDDDSMCKSVNELDCYDLFGDYSAEWDAFIRDTEKKDVKPNGNDDMTFGNERDDLLNYINDDYETNDFSQRRKKSSLKKQRENNRYYGYNNNRRGNQQWMGNNQRRNRNRRNYYNNDY